MMRKKAIIFLSVIALIVAIFAYFFRDRYIEHTIEHMASNFVGARVELDGFHLSVLHLTCSWQRLQVTDPRDTWKNILETGRADFSIEPRPLFWRRLVIRQMRLEDVHSGSRRATDGKLPRKNEAASRRGQKPGLLAKVGQSLKNQLRSLPIFDLSALGKKLNLSALIDTKQLASVQGYTRLKTTVDSSFAHWQTQISDPQIVQQIRELEDETRQLKLQKPKDVASLTLQIKKIQDIQAKTRAIISKIDNTQKDLNRTFVGFQDQLRELRRRVSADVQHAQQLARLGDLQIKDVGLLLLGEALVRRIDQILGYVETTRRYMPTAQKLMQSQKVQKPPRFKGQDIRFPFHARYPKFLLREAKLTVSTAHADTSRVKYFRGSISGLTNEPVVYGRPTRLELLAGRQGGNQYAISGAFDHTQSQASDTLVIRAGNFGLGEVKLSRSAYFPESLVAKKGDVSLRGIFAGEAVDLKLKLSARPVVFQFGDNQKGEIARIVRAVLGDIRQLDLQGELVGRQEDYHLRLQTNIDRVLGQRLKGIFDEKLRNAREQIAKYIRSETEKRRREVEGLINARKKVLFAEADRIAQRARAQLAELEKYQKELQSRIDAEKQKARKIADEKKKRLEKEAERSLKKLFKKKKN